MHVFLMIMGTIAAFSTTKEASNLFNLLMIVFALGCYLIAYFLIKK